METLVQHFGMFKGYIPSSWACHCTPREKLTPHPTPEHNFQHISSCTRLRVWVYTNLHGEVPQDLGHDENVRVEGYITSLYRTAVRKPHFLLLQCNNNTTDLNETVGHQSCSPCHPFLAPNLLDSGAFSAPQRLTACEIEKGFVATEL